MMGSLITELSDKAQAEKRIVALRTNPSEPGNFVLGYVIGYNDETISLRVINPNGLVHGLRSIRLTEVFQADYDDRYIRNVELKENNLDKIYGRLKTPALLDEAYITIPELLQQSQHLQHVSYFVTCSGAVVKQQTKEEILVDCYNEYGENDGLSVFRIEDIKSIIWSDEDIRAIEIRFQERQKTT